MDFRDSKKTGKDAFDTVNKIRNEDNPFIYGRTQLISLPSLLSTNKDFSNYTLPRKTTVLFPNPAGVTFPRSKLIFFVQ